MSECRKFRTQLALNSFRMGDLPPYTSWKKCRRLSSNRRHLDPEGALPGRVPVDGVEHFIFIRKYKLLRRQMQEYAEKNGLSFIDEFDLSTLGMFRSGWKDGPRSSAKKLERMRAFFRFAQRRNWISNNRTIDLKAPKVTLSPTFHSTTKRCDGFLTQPNGTRKKCRTMASRTVGVFEDLSFSFGTVACGSATQSTSIPKGSKGTASFTFCNPFLRVGLRIYGAGDGNRTHVRRSGRL
jgi:hypothetical protein